MTQAIFRKLFPKLMILNEIRNFVNSGNDPGEFPETFSRYWKKFPEMLLSHAAFLGKISFPENPLSHTPFFGNCFRDLPICRGDTMILIKKKFDLDFF